MLNLSGMFCCVRFAFILSSFNLSANILTFITSTVLYRKKVSKSKHLCDIKSFLQFSLEILTICIVFASKSGLTLALEFLTIVIVRKSNEKIKYEVFLNEVCGNNF